VFYIITSGSANGVIRIEPENPVVRLGDPAQLMCKVRGPIKSCLWEINGELYTLQEGAKYQPLGNLQDGECGIQAYVTEQENGQWTCRVFVEGVVDRAERASTNVTILCKNPFPSIVKSLSINFFVPTKEKRNVLTEQKSLASCELLMEARDSD